LRNWFIGITLEEVVFVIFAIGLLLFTLLSIISKDSRNSVVNFLTASFLLANVAALIFDAIIGIAVSILYASMSSLLLLTTRMERGLTKRWPKKNVILAIIAFIITSILLCLSLNASRRQRETASFAPNVNFDNDVILLISFAFIVVFSGIAFLVAFNRRRKRD
jgi:H+/Cl- antiporter ClcA